MSPSQEVHWPIGHFASRSGPLSLRARRVLRYVDERLKTVLHSQDIPNLITDALGPDGIRTAFIARHLPHFGENGEIDIARALIASNMDPRSHDVYVSQSLHRTDLRIQLSRIISRPFLWNEISHIPSQHLIYKNAAAFGMNVGICLPCNAGKQIGGIVLSAQTLQNTDELLEICAIISQPIFNRAIALAGHLPLNEPNCSIRERELIWCIARGMTNTEISKQICLSVSSVKKIIREIGKKTNTTRREQLVLCGVRLGLIY